MIFTALHYAGNLIPGNFSNQTKNLITFLVGVILYTWLWSYLFNKKKQLNSFLNGIKYGFSYILIADCISCGIIYKNYYQTSILNSVKDTWGDNTQRTKNGTPIITKTPIVETVEEIVVIPEKTPEQDLSIESSEIDSPKVPNVESNIVEGSETSHVSEETAKPDETLEKVGEITTNKPVISQEKKPKKKNIAKIEVEKTN